MRVRSVFVVGDSPSKSWGSFARRCQARPWRAPRVFGRRFRSRSLQPPSRSWSLWRWWCCSNRQTSPRAPCARAQACCVPRDGGCPRRGSPQLGRDRANKREAAAAKISSDLFSAGFDGAANELVARVVSRGHGHPGRAVVACNLEVMERWLLFAGTHTRAPVFAAVRMSDRPSPLRSAEAP